MNLNVRIKGFAAALTGLGEAEKFVARGVEQGLLAAGKALERASRDMVPVDTGELQDSSYAEQGGRGFETRVHVGYTAEHAPVVHEDVQVRHSGGQSAKFLERPAREKRNELAKIAGRKARLK